MKTNVIKKRRLINFHYFSIYTFKENARLYPWDREELDIRDEHPRDTGVSKFDTAMFDIDRFEEDI